jgi:hypothetical protein
MFESSPQVADLRLWKSRPSDLDPDLPAWNLWQCAASVFHYDKRVFCLDRKPFCRDKKLFLHAKKSFFMAKELNVRGFG